jgi:predicted nucleotidyltransferase
MNAELAPLLATLRGVLRDRQDVHLALLFGSQATGRSQPGSDIDLAVQGEDIDRLALARDLSLATRHEVDVIDLRSAGYPLLNAIARDGVVVHQGRPGAAGRWLSHTITQLETDRPNYERMRDAFLRKLAAGSHG